MQIKLPVITKGISNFGLLTTFMVLFSGLTFGQTAGAAGKAEAVKELQLVKSEIRKVLENRRFFSFRNKRVPPSLLLSAESVPRVDFKNMKPKPKGAFIFSQKFDYALGEKLQPVNGYLVIKALFEDSNEARRFVSELSGLKPLGELIIDSEFVSYLYQRLILFALSEDDFAMFQKVIANSVREEKKVRDVIVADLTDRYPQFYLKTSDHVGAVKYFTVLGSFARASQLPKVNFFSGEKLAKSLMNLGKFGACVKIVERMDKELSQTQLDVFQKNLLIIRKSACYRKSFQTSKALGLMGALRFDRKSFTKDDFFLWSEAIQVFIESGEYQKARNIDLILLSLAPDLANDGFGLINRLSVNAYLDKSQIKVPVNVELWDKEIAGFPESSKFFFYVELIRALVFHNDLQRALDIVKKAEKARRTLSDLGTDILPYLLVQTELFARTKNQAEFSRVVKSLDQMISQMDSGKEQVGFLRNFWMNHYNNKSVGVANIPAEIPRKSPWLSGVFQVAK